MFCLQIRYKIAQKGNMGQIRDSDEFSPHDWFKTEAPSKAQKMDNCLINLAMLCEFTAEWSDISLLQKRLRWCLHLLPTQKV